MNMLNLIGRDSELFEEFFTDKEILGVIKNEADFEGVISDLKSKREWSKEEIVKLFFYMIPDFGQKETGKYLDGRM